jgi:hypothetical protein
LQDEAEKVQEETTSTTEGADVEQGDAAAEKENN